MKNIKNIPAPETLIGSFLSAFDLDATAHARIDLTNEEKASLKAFANGRLDETQRKSLIPLLSHNTLALEYLADLLKKAKSQEYWGHA